MMNGPIALSQRIKSLDGESMSESKLDSLRKHGLIGCVSMSEPIKIKTDLWEVFKIYLDNAIDLVECLEPQDFETTTIIQQLQELKNSKTITSWIMSEWKPIETAPKDGTNLSFQTLKKNNWCGEFKRRGKKYGKHE